MPADVPLVDTLQHWVRSLPPGIAQLRVYASDAGPEALQIDIEPQVNLDAAKIGIHIHTPSGYVNLWAGEGFTVDTAYWPDMPIVAICDAIVSGGLREEARYWKGRVTGSKWWLQLHDTEEQGNDIDLWGDLWRLLLGTWMGTASTRRVQHPAYFSPKRTLP